MSVSEESKPIDRFGRPLRDLRISVTDRCNFRCTYCMPAEIFGERYEFLPLGDSLTFEEIERLSRLFVGLGVKKLRITGGEPLMRAGLPDLIARLVRIEGVEDLSLTTNGYLLARQARALAEAGLRRISVSLDSLDEDVFRQMNGRNYGTGPVLEGIEAASREGLAPVKINAVAQRGVNDHTLVGLARHFKGTGHIVRFIEYMDVGNRNGWSRRYVIPGEEIVSMISAEMPLEPVEPNYRGEVATRYRYADGGGEIGVITSVSKPFCGDCSRVRLSTDGKMVTCLFATGGTDLRGPMRAGASDDEVREVIAGTWSGRVDRYSELRPPDGAPEGDVTGRKIEMFQIGG